MPNNCEQLPEAHEGKAYVKLASVDMLEGSVPTKALPFNSSILQHGKKRAGPDSRGAAKQATGAYRGWQPYPKLLIAPVPKMLGIVPVNLQLLQRKALDERTGGGGESCTPTI